MKEAAVRVQNVSKNFCLTSSRATTLKSLFTGFHKDSAESGKIQHALIDIDFEVKKGEFFGIVGRNGSGKSTLLKIIAGIYQPTRGKVSVGGKLVPFIELGVGFNPDLTGKENIYMNGAMLGFSARQVDEFYKEVVEFAELGEFMGKKLKNYSSGMQVRLAFAMAIRADADILLVDEVLAVGDADFQRKCFRYFKSLKQQKKTVIFVTHDMNAVREYCDRAILIEKQKIAAAGSADKVAQEYEKLLQPTAGEQEIGGENDKWGDGLVKFTGAKIISVTEKTIKIKAKIKATENCKDLVYGFSMKNGAGVNLAGTNTTIEKIKTLPLKKNEEKSIEWSFENVFSDGKYFISLAVAHESGHTMAEWWENALILSVTRKQLNPYPVVPRINFSI